MSLALASLDESSRQESIGGNMGGIRQGSRERAFAKRLEQALDNHPRCPDDYGRLTWVMRELSHQRIEVTIETVRRWLTAVSMPRRPKMTALAKILGVDETWLAMGVQPVDSNAALKAQEVQDVLRQIEELTDNEEIKEIIARTRH
ncbi:MAG: hypothetical protein HC843_02755 [Sphingomonadales bacterium]|nr:hypothetical protein [Sphingomonadales bacterium]